MNKLKTCPLCGGETILVQQQSGFSLALDFSIICLDCGMEFKIRRHPTSNFAEYINDPGKAAKEVIEMFNRRAVEEVEPSQEATNEQCL